MAPRNININIMTIEEHFFMIKILAGVLTVYVCGRDEKGLVEKKKKKTHPRRTDQPRKQTKKKT